LLILDDVAKGIISAEEVLTETIRLLLVVRDERKTRIDTLVKALNRVRALCLFALKLSLPCLSSI
jgi:hypothetical protein